MRNCAIFVLASYCLVLKCFKYYMTMAVSLVLKDLRISCSILADPMRMWNWIIYEMQQKKKNIYPEAAVTLSAAVCCVLGGLGGVWGTPWEGHGALCQEGSLLLGVFLPFPPSPGPGVASHPCQHCSLCSRDVHRRQNVLEPWCGPAPSWLREGEQLLCPHLCLPIHPSPGPFGAACPTWVVIWGVGSPCIPYSMGWEPAWGAAVGLWVPSWFLPAVHRSRNTSESIPSDGSVWGFKL